MEEEHLVTGQGKVTRDRCHPAPARGPSQQKHVSFKSSKFKNGSGCSARVVAASEAVQADSAALASGALAVPAATRGAAAALGPWGSPRQLRGNQPRPTVARQQPTGSVSPAPEFIQPPVRELSWAMRTNILCTVRSCSEILPNCPALNRHLVKSYHRL